ncbi:hypothetical protein CP965_07295 [Halarcobacter mediterraneus]|uniref:Methyltransferase FkbM domain-containing protein n=1 Tax=Halarcobacter mediterraneus TaxID=2023153 RepID=A0A4Q1B435_9BACT|nr:FkbM family methyltransferase [Halarcobacter mediterraneus]RXK13595.1 hypothetical protein CP965_07295 [Halarcobacter mediterraneus]
MPLTTEHRNINVGGDDLDLSCIKDVPTFIIDVGVSAGTPWLYESFPNANYVLIDPLNVVDELNIYLSKMDYKFHEVALSSEDGGILTINMDTEQPALSSILPLSKHNERGHELKEIKVNKRRLDSLLNEEYKEEVTSNTTLLKIDTEGYELEIVKGATEILEHIDYLICEVSVYDRFENGYTLLDLLSFLDKQGFILSEVLRFAKLNGKVVVGDMLFIKKGRKNES